ncbi:MAG TPA: type II secretion system F family protein [Actinomycetes bacterium]
MIAAVLAALGALLLVATVAAPRLTGGRRPRGSSRPPRLDRSVGLPQGRTPGIRTRGVSRTPGISGKPGRRSRREGVHRRGTLVVVVGGGAATAAVLATAGNSLGMLLLAGVGGIVVIRQAVARRAASRLRAERAAAAPAVIDLLSACLLAGLNPYRALLRVAERSPDALRAELRRAAAELDMGRTPAAALRAVGDRTSLDELRAVAAALEAAERWGAPPAEALAARAEALRSRARLRAEAEAGRAAVRLAFPLVFCFLPAFVLLVVVPTMAGALRVLTH